MKRILALSMAAVLCTACGAKKTGGGGGNGPGEECESVLDCASGLACVEGVCSYPEDAASDPLTDTFLPDVADAPADTGADPDVTTDTGMDVEPDTGLDADLDGTDVPTDLTEAVDATADVVDELCMFRPPVAEFTPQMECIWNSSDTAPTKIDVVATPAVANLTDDNGDTLIDTQDVPDIAVVTYDYPVDGCCNAQAVLRVLSGRCNSEGHLPEHYTITDPPLDNSSAPAVGDIDGDGLPEIVAAQNRSGTVAFEHDGTEKWRTIHPDRDTYADSCIAYQPALVDLDSDGIAEVVAGRVVLDGLTGAVRWRGLGSRGLNAFMGPISVAADIDLDTIPEVVAGNSVYSADGWLEWTYDYGSSLGTCQTACGMACDGYNAIGDFDADPYAEVVIVVAERVFVLEHDGTLKTMIPIPRETSYSGYNEGGPPTIADFDGDTEPEIGVAAANYYVVVDLECTDPLPADCESEGIRWSVVNNDESSRVTGSSVFDFEGDGMAEVVYNDETHFRIFSGLDGAILFEWENYSHTRLEYPVIADVDDDGNAEILFIENRRGGEDPGLEVWGDASDTWVPTRRIWNQHAYHITNINEDGTMPLVEMDNWLVYNNYRQNLPDFSPFLAPDLTVQFDEVDETPCTDHVDMIVQVCNEGDLRVGAGVEVAFYEGDPATGTPITCTDPPVTLTTLDPDECELVTCSWTGVPVHPESADVTACVDDVDGTCTAPGANNECNEDNNTASIEDVQCDIIG